MKHSVLATLSRVDFWITLLRESQVLGEDFVMVGYLRRFVRVVGLAVGVLGCGSVLLGVVSSPAVAATGSWSTKVDLSATGGAAGGPQISARGHR